jgi:uncharacterized repeat protein (TIGR02543 family)
MKKIFTFTALLLSFLTIVKAENEVKITVPTETVQTFLDSYFEVPQFTYYTGLPLHLVQTGTGTSLAAVTNPWSYYGPKIKRYDCRDFKQIYSSVPVGLGLYLLLYTSFPLLEEVWWPLKQTGTTHNSFVNGIFPSIKSLHIPEGVTGFTGTLKIGATHLLENLYIDNPVAPSSTGAFDNIMANVTLYVPEEGMSAYASSASWSSFKEIKPRRKVIFHMGDNPTDRVSFTYTGSTGSGDDRQFYWYSTVGEPMETPEMDEGNLMTPTWYTDAARSVPWDLSASVPASPDPDNPTPLHLYASWSNTVYYTIKLHWSDGRADTETEAEENTVVAQLISVNPSRGGYYFAGWYDNPQLEGDRYDPGVSPRYDDQGEIVTDGVKYLASDLELYAKWENRPWIYKPVVVEMDGEGSLPESFAGAFAARTEFTDQTLSGIYAVARMEIRGTISYDLPGFSGGYSSWYSLTLRDKVVSLDLREAHITPSWSDHSYEGVWAYYYSIIREIRLPIDGTFTKLGSPFGHVAPSVQSIYLPESVTRIDGPVDNQCASPFAFTYALKNVYLDAETPPAVSSYVWHQAGNFTLHVPEGSKSAYEADKWSDASGACKWTHRSVLDGGANVNITLTERPKVTFHTNGGSRPLYAYTPVAEDGTYYWYVSAGTSAYSSNFPVDTAPVTERTGYRFIGWFTNEALTQPYEATTAVNLGEGGLDLYAKWATYTVTLHWNMEDMDDEEVEAPENAVVATIPPANPTHADFAFAGWFTDAALTQALAPEALLTGDTTLWAKWDAPSATGISTAGSVSKVVKGYYSIIGEKLPQAPEQGFYIILYTDGSAKKILKIREY